MIVFCFSFFGLYLFNFKIDIDYCAYERHSHTYHQTDDLQLRWWVYRGLLLQGHHLLHVPVVVGHHQDHQVTEVADVSPVVVVDSLVGQVDYVVQDEHERKQQH